jgi:hypothetical protein
MFEQSMHMCASCAAQSTKRKVHCAYVVQDCQSWQDQLRDADPACTFGLRASSEGERELVLSSAVSCDASQACGGRPPISHILASAITSCAGVSTGSCICRPNENSGSNTGASSIS